MQRDTINKARAGSGWDVDAAPRQRQAARPHACFHGAGTWLPDPAAQLPDTLRGTRGSVRSLLPPIESDEKPIVPAELAVVPAAGVRLAQGRESLAPLPAALRHVRVEGSAMQSRVTEGGNTGAIIDTDTR